jgi:hypothetical protein
MLELKKLRQSSCGTDLLLLCCLGIACWELLVLVGEDVRYSDIAAR